MKSVRALVWGAGAPLCEATDVRRVDREGLWQTVAFVISGAVIGQNGPKDKRVKACK